MPRKDALISNDLIDLKEKSAKITEIDKNKNTQKLIIEVILDDIERVKALLQEGININGTDEDGCTALIWAAKKDNVKMVEILLAIEGIDVNILDNSGQSAFSHAINGDEASSAVRVKIIDLLLGSKKININAIDGDGGSLLMAVACSENEEILDRILDVEELQINAVHKGINALLIAVSDYKVNFVEKLIKHGADVNTVEKEYWDEYYDAINKNVTAMGDFASEEESNSFPEYSSNSEQEDAQVTVPLEPFHTGQ